MKTILPEEVQAKLAAGEAINLIDVREVAEVEAGHIPGITHIPLGLLEFRMHELDKNKEYSERRFKNSNGRNRNISFTSFWIFN